MERLLGLLVVAVVILALAASCGDDQSGTEEVRPSIPTISVEQAAEHDGELVVVEGFVVAAPEAVHRLCSELAESYPPQCAGARLEIIGLQLARLVETSTNPELPEGERTLWTDDTVSMTGRIDGERLELAAAATDLGGGVVVVEALTGPSCPSESDPDDPACPDPVPRAGIELWGETDSVGSAMTDDLGVAVLAAAGGGQYEVVPLPVEGFTTPPRTTVTVGDVSVAVQVAYG
jgi:hypothetical protein